MNFIPKFTCLHAPMICMLWILFSYNEIVANYCIEEMNLEEKAGQVLMVHFHGNQANENAQTLISDIHVGGIIYYNWANELSSPEQVFHLSADLQALAQQNRLPIPLFIAVDQEGGIVTRLHQGFTIFPGNKALGMSHDLFLVEECAYAIGQEASACGVNLNLSPVVDINSNPRNPAIGIRSFGDSPETVISCALATLQGYRRAGMISCLKHFPGHGDVFIDSHEDLPIIAKSQEELQSMELLPFARLVDQADAVMTGHLMVPALDSLHCTTLSKPILNLLRNEMKFDGIIITDSLIMQGLLKSCDCSIEDIALQALNAGCDIILLGGRQLLGTKGDAEITVPIIRKIHQHIIDAVKSGGLAEARLNQAVQRILELKHKYKLSRNKQKNSLNQVNSAEHQMLAQNIASKALDVKAQHAFPLLHGSQRNYAVIAPSILKENILQANLLHLRNPDHSLFFTLPNPTEEEIERANRIVRRADILILYSYNAWKNVSQKDLILSLSSLKKPTIIVVTRDPLDALLFPNAHLMITTFSPTVPSLRAVNDPLCKILQNR